MAREIRTQLGGRAMKTLFALTLAIFFVSGAAAQDHSRPNPPRPQTPPPATSIPKYVSDEGRYSVMFPSDPKLSSQNITSPNGDPMVQRMAMASGDGALFMVGYFDYGVGIVFSLDKARDGMLNSVRGTLLDEQSVSLGGAPGREIKLAGQTDDGTEFINRA